eukprot:322352-Pleurochrysis_carterae.AAC.3
MSKPCDNTMYMPADTSMYGTRPEASFTQSIRIWTCSHSMRNKETDIAVGFCCGLLMRPVISKLLGSTILNCSTHNMYIVEFFVCRATREPITAARSMILAYGKHMSVYNNNERVNKTSERLCPASSACTNRKASVITSESRFFV